MAAGKDINNGTLTEKFFARMKSLTKRNLHGEAYQDAAQVLGLPELRDQFARIERDRERIGHLPFDLNQERYGAYQRLMQHAKRQLAPAQYNRFYMCF